jgi:hypothetical protein
VLASTGWIFQRAFGAGAEIPTLVERAADYAVWVLAAVAGFALLVTALRLRAPQPRAAANLRKSI